MTIWTKTKSRYERKDNNHPMKWYRVPVCPNDGSPVMPFIGTMGKHDEGLCTICGVVKFMMVDERNVESLKNRLAEMNEITDPAHAASTPDPRIDYRALQASNSCHDKIKAGWDTMKEIEL
jgi:poly(3-hydroxybutyrate) depolymerase